MRCRSLPDAVCSLKRLEYLSINCPYLETLPSQLGRLRSLKYLNVGASPVLKYPYSMRYLTDLQTFEIAEESQLWGEFQKAEFDRMTVLQQLILLSDRSLNTAGSRPGQDRTSDGSGRGGAGRG